MAFPASSTSSPPLGQKNVCRSRFLWKLDCRFIESDIFSIEKAGHVTHELQSFLNIGNKRQVKDSVGLFVIGYNGFDSGSIIYRL